MDGSQAATATAGTGPGSHGCESKGASSIIRSDPHNPHRRTDVETVLQAWQYTALSTGIETSSGFDRIIMTFRIVAPISESSGKPWIKRRTAQLPLQVRPPKSSGVRAWGWLSSTQFVACP